MSDKKLLGIVYDILAQNEVSEEDRQGVLEKIQYVDYDNEKIVFGEQTPRGLVETVDFTLHNRQEEV